MSDGLHPAVFIAAVCVVGACYGRALLLVRHVDEKVRVRALLWVAIGAGVMMVASVLDGSSFGGAVNAAVAAFTLWQWWNSGGGGGMKKLLKKAAGYLGFGPQAAPSSA